MKGKKIKTWILERYVLGELSPKKMAELNSHLQVHPKLKKEIDRLKKSNGEIISQYPPSTIIPKILNRYQEEKSKHPKPVLLKRLLYLSPILASALVILLVLLPHQEDKIRLKGTQGIDLTKTSLMIHRKSDESIDILSHGDRVRTGDLLQIAYIAAGTSHGVIISIDGEGMVTLHYPYTEYDSTLLEQNKKILLANAYELDQAREFERFFFITSNSEINVEDILKRAEDLAGHPAEAKKENLNLSSVFHQISILLVKESVQK